MRISENPHHLTQQLRFSALAAAGEPGWVGPTPVELDAIADAIEASEQEVARLVLDLRTARTKLSLDVEAGRGLMKRVDSLATAMYGKGSGHKSQFGLKPEDIIRNRAPIPDIPSKLTLSDGQAGMVARWKGTLRASYEVQWFFDPELERLAGSMVSTTQKITIPGFAPGTELFLRVRATISGRFSEWSGTVSRFVNG